MSNCKQYADPLLVPKKQLSKKIIFPMFQDISELTNDDYWKQILQDASHGKFPKNSGIDSKTGALFIKRGKQTYWLNLPNNKIEALESIKKFFSEKLNLRSRKDQKIIRKETDKQRQELLENLDVSEWKDIRKKSIKDSILREFVINLSKQYNLDYIQSYEAYNVIKLGILFNWIDSNNIEYHNRKIIRINVLYYDTITKKFFINHDFNKYVKRDWDLRPKNLSDNWLKHNK